MYVDMYLIVGKGTVDKTALIKQLMEWKLNDTESVLKELDKRGSVILGKHKICKFK